MDQAAEQRQREEAVGDGCAEGGLAAGALGVDVNPLRIAGQRGETVDHGLGDFEPRADAGLAAFERLDLGKGHGGKPL